MALYMIQPFEIERAVDLDHGVEMELGNRLTGRVTNRTGYGFQAAYLQFHGWRYLLGEIPEYPGFVTR